MDGKKDVYDSVNILFEADLRPWTEDRPARCTSSRTSGCAALPHDQRAATAGASGEFAQGARATRRRISRPSARRSWCGWRRRARLSVKVLGVARGSRRPCRRAVSSTAASSRRRRCARDAADRRLRHEHRRAGRAQSRLEARRGAAGRRQRRLLETYHDERQPLGAPITEQSLANAISMGACRRRARLRARGRSISTSRA